LYTFASGIKKVINWGEICSALRPPAVFGSLTPLKARMVCLRETGRSGSTKVWMEFI